MESKKTRAKDKGASRKIGPAVIWAIQNKDYFMESIGDGRPIFHHTDFTYKAVAPGAGTILWYIECTEQNKAHRPCPVRGVRHKDGRLLMLRAHNHFVKTPAKRCVTSTAHRNNNKPVQNGATAKPTALTVPAAIQDRWISLTQKNLNDVKVTESGLVQSSRETSVRNVNHKAILTDSVKYSLQDSLQDRWRSARRRSVLSQLSAANGCA